MKRMASLVWCMLFLVPLLHAADTSMLLQDRLRALDPDHPGAYIELAELIADDITSEADRRLSIRLFAIAATLDPVRWGRSGRAVHRKALRMARPGSRLSRLRRVAAREAAPGSAAAA